MSPQVEWRWLAFPDPLAIQQLGTGWTVKSILLNDRAKILNH